MMVARQKESKATIVWRIFLGSLSTVTLGGVVKLVWLFSTVITTQAVQDQRLNALESNFNKHDIMIKSLGDVQIRQGESISHLSGRKNYKVFRDDSND